MTLYLGDAFTIPEHIAYPEWMSSFELDKARALETRRRLLDRAVADNCQVIHYHVGPIGRVVRQGSGYMWEPECNAAVA